MLNYVWIALIILGIGTALYFDIKIHLKINIETKNGLKLIYIKDKTI
jgi:hypothetical protein